MSESSKKQESLATVIMAAGMGTRMKRPDLAKVMFELRGKPLVHYVADFARAIGSERIVAIVGYQRERVMEYLQRTHPGILYVVQEPQLGTGHAVMQTEAALNDFSGSVLVLSGDVPLLQPQTMETMLQLHRSSGAVATMLTADLEDPSGYGRVIRNGSGIVEKIVEHRDASPDELQQREINSGIYLFKKERLFDGLKHLTPHNAQNEYYLTDVFAYFWKQRWTVAAFKAPNADEIQGINTVEQLEQAQRILDTRQRATAQ
ncbi:MAG TPA: sugar phosphate nucleotidyltransferase [Bacteroidota bacterium]